jgi:CDP-diacylglycerol---serine O-phosphatidyltransferase
MLPTLFTLGNGVCGLLAIMLITHRPPEADPVKALFWAAILIFLGMVFDFVDGYVARLTRQVSRFGAELDSLCDLITFCVAPMFIVLTFDSLLPQRLLWGIAVLYAMAGALRLARFNANKDFRASTDYFVGLPTPAAAGTIASFAIAWPALNQLAEPQLAVRTQALAEHLLNASMVFVPAMALVLAWLMTSRIRYPHLARQLARRRSFSKFVELIFALVLVIVLHELALPVILCYFVFAFPTHQLRLKLTGQLPPHEDVPAQELRVES